MKNVIVFFGILSLLTLITSKNCFAQTDIVILGADYKAPKIYKEAGEPKGILVDIIRYADNKMQDYTLTIKLYPFARAYHYALQGKGGIIGLSKNSERLKVFDYSQLLYQDEIVIVTKQGNEFPFNKVEDLRGKAVGVIRGGSYGEEYEQAKRAGVITVEEDNSPILSLKKLLVERLDAVITSPGAASLSYSISQNRVLQQNSSQFSILPLPLMIDPNFLGFKKSMEMEKFLNEWNVIIKSGYENGDIQQIIDQHIHPLPVKRQGSVFKDEIIF